VENSDRRTLADGGASDERQPGAAMPRLVVAAIVIAGLYFARPVLEPFALAVLLSLMLAPAVHWLHHHGLGRMPAVGVTVVVATVVILGLLGAVGDEAVNLARGLPQYEANITAKIRSLNSDVPGAGVFGRATRVFRDLSEEFAGAPQPQSAATGEKRAPVPVEIRQPEMGPLQVVPDIVAPLLSPIASVGLVLVFVVMILLKREDLRDRVLRLAGAQDLHRTTAAMNEAAERVSHYLLMQLVVGICYGLPLGIGLAVIGIPNAALWGILGVVLRFIPYLGGLLTAVFPVALAIAVSPGWSHVIWTVLLFIGVELIIGNIVEPWVYSRSTGLSAVAVIAAATFWTWLWGMVGLLMATPLTVCLVVLGRYVPHLEFLGILLGNQPVLSPEETLYQRLLAHDPEEATEQAEQFARDKSIAAFFDEVAIPALVMAQADSDRGALAPRRRAVVAEGLATMLDNLVEDAPAGDAKAEPQPVAVVCLAGRNELDLAAAWLLQHLLQRAGHPAAVFAPDAVSAINVDRLQLRGVPVVCLSLLSTSSAARARYLVRRIRRRARRTVLVIGFWGQQGPEFSSGEAVAATAADHAVTTLSAAVAAIAAALGDGSAADTLPAPPSLRA
jgi:predicted PurR-regulated permease PerM